MFRRRGPEVNPKGCHQSKMTENPKVVVLGPPGVGKKALALALQSRSNTVTVSSIGGT
jgi:DNA replication protein DnaC